MVLRRSRFVEHNLLNIPVCVVAKGIIVVTPDHLAITRLATMFGLPSFNFIDKLFCIEVHTEEFILDTSTVISLGHGRYLL